MGEKVVIKQVHQNATKAAILRADSADASLNDRMRVGESVNAEVLLNAALERLRQRW